MTKKEIFEKVRDHLLKQNALSKDEFDGRCLYRSENGLKCAIGCLISDEDYRDSFEGKNIRGIHEIIINKILPSDLDGENGIVFLQKLQNIHDLAPIGAWEKNLNELAEEWSIK